MNHDAQLKLQAFLDGELSDREAAEVQAWLANDQQGRLLLTELQNTMSGLAGHEAGVKLPESREFFWSKIAREIERPAPAPARPPAVSWLARLRSRLMPMAGVATVTITLSLVLLHSLRGTGPLAEMELASEDVGAYTFRDQANKMTMVWFYDRTADSQFTDEAPLASVDPQ